MSAGPLGKRPERSSLEGRQRDDGSLHRDPSCVFPGPLMSGTGLRASEEGGCRAAVGGCMEPAPGRESRGAQMLASWLCSLSWEDREGGSRLERGQGPCRRHSESPGAQQPEPAPPVRAGPPQAEAQGTPRASREASSHCSQPSRHLSSGLRLPGRGKGVLLWGEGRKDKIGSHAEAPSLQNRQCQGCTAAASGCPRNKQA